MRKNKKKNKTMLILILVLAFSLGYAIVSTTLKINGTTTVVKQTWNVYWANVKVTEGSKAASTPVIEKNGSEPLNTKVTWSVTFTEPGDFYEFTIDAVNAGTVDAKISEIKTTINNNGKNKLPKYIKYTVSYEDGTSPQLNDILGKATKVDNVLTPTTKKYKIRVEYDGDIATIETMNNMRESGLQISFVYDIKYSQPNLEYKESKINIAEVMNKIISNRDENRNPEQDLQNEDIGIDEYGNVINLDWWIDKNTGYKLYRMAEYNDREVELSSRYCDSSYCYTGATASENIEDGEMTEAVIPAYILFADKNAFYPVTEIYYLFSNYKNKEVEETKFITKLPDLPSTISTIGEHTFANLHALENVVIPKNVKVISDNAFWEAFSEEGMNNTLSFEEGSILEEIEYNAFYNNGLTGNIVFPRSLQRIGSDAFRNNSLTQVTLPSSMEYYDYIFDDNVTIVNSD